MYLCFLARLPFIFPGMPEWFEGDLTVLRHCLHVFRAKPESFRAMSICFWAKPECFGAEPECFGDTVENPPLVKSPHPHRETRSPAFGSSHGRQTAALFSDPSRGRWLCGWLCSGLCNWLCSWDLRRLLFQILREDAGPEDGEEDWRYAQILRNLGDFSTVLEFC